MGATIEELMIPGRLNPAANDDTKYHVRSSTTSGFGTLSRIINERFERRTLSGISQFKAIVYKVDSTGAQDPAQAPERTSNANQKHITGQDTPNSVVIRACVPEIHGHLPVPSELPKKNGDIDSVNRDIIDMYPEFTSRDSNTVKPPVPGEIVWVTFANLETFSGGIYIGKLNNESEEIKVKFPKRARNKFKKKCRFCTMAPKGEDLAAAQHKIDWQSNQLVWQRTIDVTTAVGSIPFGKGLFAKSINTKKFKPSKARETQISWVALEIENKNYSSSKIKNIQKAIADYHKNGIRAYLHAKPERGKNEEFLKIITSLMTGSRSKKPASFGVGIDKKHKDGAEKELFYPGVPIGFLIDFTDYLAGSTNTAATIAPAASLWKNLHKMVKGRGLSIGFTIKDIKSSNDRVRIGLPYSTFATGDYEADFSVIQWEWITALAHDTPDVKQESAERRFDAFEKAYTIYKALKFKNIIPALSANRFYVTDPAMEATGEEMRIDALKMFAGHPIGTDPVIKEQANAVIWDDWSGAIDTKKGGWTEKRWEILEEFGNLTKRAEKLNKLNESTSMDAYQKLFIQQNGLEGLMTGIVAEFDDFVKAPSGGRTVWKDNVFLPRGSTRSLYAAEANPKTLFFEDYKEEYYDSLSSILSSSDIKDSKGRRIKSPGNINPATFTLGEYVKLRKQKQKRLIQLVLYFKKEYPDWEKEDSSILSLDSSVSSLETEKAQNKTIYEICDSDIGA